MEGRLRGIILMVIVHMLDKNRMIINLSHRASAGKIGSNGENIDI